MEKVRRLTDPSSSGVWEIDTKDYRDPESNVETRQFDAVFVCNGWVIKKIEYLKKIYDSTFNVQMFRSQINLSN